jgi:hypothetical protein
MARSRPMRSMSMPANTALAAYVTENALRISPYCSFESRNSACSSGATVARVCRSR